MALEQYMRTRKRTVLIVAAVTVALLGLTLLAGFVYVWTDPFYVALRQFEKHFEQIAIGMAHEDVERRLGAPDWTDKEFRLGQKEGSEDAYKRAAESDAQYYLFWQRGVDMVFTVGFNAADEAVVVESGGT